MPTTKESLFETFHIDEEGVDRVIERIKKLVEEGNARRLLVKNREQGAALAKTLGSHSIALMRGHGYVAVGRRFSRRRT